MSSPMLPSLTVPSSYLPSPPRDTSFDLPSSCPPPPSLLFHSHNFLSQSTIHSRLSPRSPPLNYQSIIIQQKQKLQHYRAKLKPGSKNNDSIPLNNIPSSPTSKAPAKLTTLLSKITNLASKLSKLDDIQKNSLRSNSFQSRKYSQSNQSQSRSSKYDSKLKKHRSIEEIRMIVERPERERRVIGGITKQYCERMERLNYQPVSSRNKIRMLFEDRRKREGVIREHEKRLERIRSWDVLPGVKERQRQRERERDYLMEI